MTLDEAFRLAAETASKYERVAYGGVEVHDLIQEARIAVWSKFNPNDPPEYVKRTAKDGALMALRREPQFRAKSLVRNKTVGLPFRSDALCQTLRYDLIRKDRTPPIEAVDRAPSFYPAVERALLMEQVRAAIAELHPQERRCLEAYYFDELSYAEIGKKRNVRANVVRAVQKLRRAFSRAATEGHH